MKYRNNDERKLKFKIKIIITYPVHIIIVVFRLSFIKINKMST